MSRLEMCEYCMAWPSCRKSQRCLACPIAPPAAKRRGTVARWLRGLVRGSWHTIWAAYHLERIDDPVEFTSSDGICHHDNRYKYHRRKLNKLSANIKSESTTDNE